MGLGGADVTVSQSIRDTIERGAGKRRIRFVVIHTEGDRVNSDTSVAAIRKFHTAPVASGGNGWRDVGYNLWIRMNGLVEMGRPFDLIPAHAAGFNTNSIGVGLAGDGNVADFTLAQYDSLFEVSWLLASRFGVPWAHFIGHREVERFGAPPPHKTCPGLKVDLDRFRAMLAEPR